MDTEIEPQVDTPPVAEHAPESARMPPPRPHADRASQTRTLPDAYFTRRPDQAADFRTKRFLTGLGIWAAGFVLAFWLSWSTNSNWNRGVFAKLSYGIGAGVHSWSYLLLWVMYIWGRHDPAAFVAKIAIVTPIDVVS